MGIYSLSCCALKEAEKGWHHQAPVKSLCKPRLRLQLPCCLQAEQVGAWEELPGSVKLEVGSPRAFLCEDPRFLTRPISMRGHPKLWQLPPQILSRAAACLQLPPQVMHRSMLLSCTSVHTYLSALLRSMELYSHPMQGSC